LTNSQKYANIQPGLFKQTGGKMSNISTSEAIEGELFQAAENGGVCALDISVEQEHGPPQRFVYAGNRRYGPFEVVRELQVTDDGEPSFHARAKDAEGGPKDLFCVSGEMFRASDLYRHHEFFGNGRTLTHWDANDSHMWLVQNGREHGPFRHANDVQWASNCRHPGDAACVFHASHTTDEGVSGRYIFRGPEPVRGPFRRIKYLRALPCERFLFAENQGNSRSGEWYVHFGETQNGPFKHVHRFVVRETTNAFYCTARGDDDERFLVTHRGAFGPFQEITAKRFMVTDMHVNVTVCFLAKRSDQWFVYRDGERIAGPFSSASLTANPEDAPIYVGIDKAGKVSVIDPGP
jgi:hypothetical protein